MDSLQLLSEIADINDELYSDGRTINFTKLFRDSKLVKTVVDELHAITTQNWTIMEICGANALHHAIWIGSITASPN